MKTVAIILTLELQCIILLGQPGDSIRHRIQSATYKIFYEVNQKTIDLPPQHRFYATDGEKNFQAELRGANNYQFNELPDSFAVFVLEFGITKIETPRTSSKYHYGQDATVIFSSFNNIDQLRNLWKQERKQRKADPRIIMNKMPCENIVRSTDLGAPYGRPNKYKKYEQAIKKGELEFLSGAIFIYCSEDGNKRGYRSSINPVELKK